MSGSNDCGCCQGIAPETPVSTSNRQGLSQISYRVGVHAQFKATMLARLSMSGIEVLRGLATRDDDDFSIALIDAWAAVCDVITFYQERIANENYLRTATERLSLIELGRLINYRLQPGVAASTDLAFTLDASPGALGQSLGVGTSAQRVPSPPARLFIDQGTKVQSIPASGEQAQTFETIAGVNARAEWNSLKPRSEQPQVVYTSTDSIYLQGTSSNLKVGDTLLVLQTQNAFNARKILGLFVDNQTGTTRVDFSNIPAEPPPFVRSTSLPAGNVNDLLTKVPLTQGLIAVQIIGKSWSGDDLAAVVAIQQWDEQALAAAVKAQLTRFPSSSQIFALRQRAAIFGHNAPFYPSLSTNLRYGEQIKDATGAPTTVPAAYPTNWENMTIGGDPASAAKYVFLDNLYPAFTVNSLMLLQVPSAAIPTGVLTALLRVKAYAETSRSAFSISAKVSQLTIQMISSGLSLSDFAIRTTTVLGQSELLPLAPNPIPNPVGGDWIMLDGLYLGLKAGEKVSVTGERADLTGNITSETVTLKAVTIEGGFTVLSFERALLYQYVRTSVTINANVAPATNGESVNEVLGNGDGTQVFQTFALRQPPLTYVSSATAGGAVSTLEVRVNDVLWHEVPTLFGHGPDERIYVTRTDEQQKTYVTFGDGRTGSRLPSGAENLSAKYRRGVGASGNLPEHRLTQLLSRPLGLQAVTNSQAATGGADPEQLEDIRKNAPVQVLTLGRIVSLQDYGNFARAFAGIAKALASWSWFGTVRGVFVTVAGAKGAAVDPASALYTNLVTAVFKAGDPTVPFQIASYRLRYFRVMANLRIDPDYRSSDVVASVEQALRNWFSFEARDFGQPVTLSEIISVMQNVLGVVAVDLNQLYRTDRPPALNTTLTAEVPAPGSGVRTSGAELLVLDVRPIDLQVIP